MRIILAAILAVVSLSVFAVESTDYHLVGKVQVQSSGDFYLHTYDVYWNADQSCLATTIYINNAVAGSDKMLSLALAAKMSSTKVAALGTCEGGSFHASHLFIE